MRDGLVAGTIPAMGTDHVWVAIETAVRQAWDEQDVVNRPPATQDDWMWLAVTVADFVAAATPKEVYKVWRQVAKPR